MRALVSLLAVALLAVAPPATAQEEGAAPSPPAGDPVAHGERAWSDGEVQASYEVLVAALETDPVNHHVLWRAARAAAALGAIHWPERDERDRWLRRAVELADRAVAADSTGLEARHWRLYAMGQLALYQGPRSAGRLGSRVFDEANALLARDSLDAYAHNALGRVQFEVKNLSRMERFLGRVVVGGKLLSTATWEAAEYHLARAVELRPDVIPFHTALGAFYARRGRPEDAKVEFRKALALPAPHPWAQALARDAQKNLDNTLSWAPDPSDPGGT